jgi:8-oxo-dGTP pyrophosphatase MutT (NUDIX family)
MKARPGNVRKREGFRGGANVLDVRLLSRVVEIRSQWLTVVGERYEEDGGTQFDYWRVEKSDSVVVVTLQRGQLILPPRTFRPGVSRVTLDLPGGRVSPGEPVADAATRAVVRELGLPDASPIKSVEQLNGTGWDVDSSTSNQRLYGAVCELSDHAVVPPAHTGATYPATEGGLSALLSDLTCLQCREVLREWRARW